MHSLSKLPVNRRGFFVTAARSVALLSLSAFAVWQESKRRRLANDSNCLKLAVCSDCVEFGRCSKPKAESAREFGART
jgi:hypothetical protein